MGKTRPFFFAKEIFWRRFEKVVLNSFERVVTLVYAKLNEDPCDLFVCDGVERGRGALRSARIGPMHNSWSLEDFWMSALAGVVFFFFESNKHARNQASIRAMCWVLHIGSYV